MSSSVADSFGLQELGEKSRLISACFWLPGRSFESHIRENTTAGSRHGWLGSGSSSQYMTSCVMRRRNPSFAIKLSWLCRCSSQAEQPFLFKVTPLYDGRATQALAMSPYLCECGSRSIKYTFHPLSRFVVYIFVYLHVEAHGKL